MYTLQLCRGHFISTLLLLGSVNCVGKPSSRRVKLSHSETQAIASKGGTCQERNFHLEGLSHETRCEGKMIGDCIKGRMREGDRLPGYPPEAGYRPPPSGFAYSKPARLSAVHYDDQQAAAVVEHIYLATSLSSDFAIPRASAQKCTIYSNSRHLIKAVTCCTIRSKS